MDGVSAAASIVGIATAGIQISIKVITLASQMSTAADRVSSIGNDVSLTSAILHQLADLMNQKTNGESFTIFSKGGLDTTKSSAETCQRIFEEVERETAKASEQIRGRRQRVGEKIKLSFVEKAKWPFLQPNLEILRTDLREAKGTLMLMLQVASLALSKRVADLNISATANAADQQDIVRSILILQRQQQQQKSALNDEFDEEPAKSAGDVQSDGFQEVEDMNPPAPTLNTHIQSLNTVTKSSVDEEARASTGPKPSDDGRKRLIIEGESPKFPGNSYSRKLQMWSIDPNINVKTYDIKLTWYRAELRTSEAEIRQRLARNQEDGHTSVLEVLETLHASERNIVAGMIDDIHDECDWVKSACCVTLVSLKRTERDLLVASLVLKAVPSFFLTIQHEHPPTFRSWSNDDKKKQSKKQVMDLSRPTFIKVHRKNLSPKTLDAYELPWEWDERDSDYIIIKQWIPEHDQKILFEHTRSLKEARERKQAVVELHREKEKLLLVRQAPTSRRQASSRSYTVEANDSSFHAHRGSYQLEVQKENLPSIERERKPYTPHSHSTSDSGSTPAEETPMFMRKLVETVDREDMGEPEEPEAECDDSVEDRPGEESDDMAAVNELLEKYTTLFERGD